MYDKEEKQVRRKFCRFTHRHENAPDQQQADPQIQRSRPALDQFFLIADQQRDGKSEKQDIFKRMCAGRKSLRNQQTIEETGNTDPESDDQQKTERFPIFSLKINTESLYLTRI